MSKLHKKNGFTLIEIMIVVAIIGIIAAIAYPAYTQQVQKARRTDGQTALLNIATLMEHYYTENNTYVGANAPADVGGSATSPEGHYTVTVTQVNASSYSLSAAPQGAQASDTCGTLTLTNTGLRGPTPATCW